MERGCAGRLLILDDDAAIGITISAIAESVSISTRTAIRPGEFFTLLTAWQPTHIVLDLMMPEIDGIEVLRRLAEMGCTAAIIITSGVGSRVLDAARRSAEGHGLAVVAAISKPFSVKALRAILLAPPPAGGERASHSVMRPGGRGAITRDMLAEALATCQLSVVYQPKVDCKSRRLIGFEALARWNHPAYGLVLPDEFIPLAESSDQIDLLTEQIFADALGWLGATYPRSDLTMSVNISAKSLADMHFADKIAAQCAKYRVDPRRIILELTETAAMNDPSTTLDLLTRLRVQGFALSIDDFGVGYSSLVQLARLPFSELKIDKMFVTSAATSSESHKITSVVVQLGHSLGLRVTAEGVEDQNVLSILQSVGCDYAQGYLIGRPMPAAKLEEWIMDHCRMIASGTS